MHNVKIINIFLLCLLCSCYGQNLFSQCDDVLKGRSSFPMPVVEGTPYTIPTIQIKAVDRTGHNEPIIDEKTTMRYNWKWYDDSEKSWVESTDSISCYTNENGLVQFLEYTLIPKGWSEVPNRYLPEFKDIEISVGMWHFWITRNQIEKVRKKELKKPLELKRKDGFIPPIKVEVWGSAD